MHQTSMNMMSVFQSKLNQIDYDDKQRWRFFLKRGPWLKSIWKVSIASSKLNQIDDDDKQISCKKKKLL